MALTAADFSGRWKGGIISTLPNGETRQTQEVHMNLTQKDNKVSGTIGPAADKQVPIEEGNVKGNRVTFRQGRNHVVELVLSGDRLVGTMRHAHNPSDPAGRLELERVKE
jgi:hypothetical protein